MYENIKISIIQEFCGVKVKKYRTSFKIQFHNCRNIFLFEFKFCSEKKIGKTDRKGYKEDEKKIHINFIINISSKKQIKISGEDGLILNALEWELARIKNGSVKNVCHQTSVWFGRPKNAPKNWGFVKS